MDGWTGNPRWWRACRAILSDQGAWDRITTYGRVVACVCLADLLGCLRLGMRPFGYGPNGYASQLKPPLLPGAV